MTLKDKLKEIQLNETTKQIDLNSLIDEMLENIGSTDSELRDTLIFNTFGKLINNRLLTTQQMEYILEVTLVKLFYRIEKKESDAVFTRSFSALVIAFILNADRESQLLSNKMIRQAIDSSITYLQLEQDIRGYVVEKGWAHSIAHGADLLTEAIKHPAFNAKLSSRILETINDCMFKNPINHIPYVDDEEERLIFAIEALVEKGTTEKELEMFINEMTEKLNEMGENENFSLNFFWKRSNVVQFLRGLYFRLLYENNDPKLRDTIASNLQQLHHKVYGDN